MEKSAPCETCRMRLKYDQNPTSFTGRFWKWHIRFCPGWKMYMQSVDDQKRISISTKYGLKRWMN